jgi:hypothetical protein
MSKVCEKLVLKNLEKEQKLQRREICVDILEKLKDDDPDF